MLSKEEAMKWAAEITFKGAGEERAAYKEKYRLGKIAEDHWNSGLFTLGVEYGILVAMEKIYQDIPAMFERNRP